MSIVDGKGLITWEGALFVPGSDLLKRTQWAFAKIRADGGTIVLNEAGRPYGVPTDQFVHSSTATASGLSTVYFQWGRYLRGETPSAANPANGSLTSEHTQGLATDTDAPTTHDKLLRAKYFAQVGMKNTISSESWHYAIRGPSLVDLNLDTTTAGGSSSPIEPQEEEDDMGTLYRADASKPTVGLAVSGWSYLRGDDGIFRALSARETEAWAQQHPAAWAKVVVWAPVDLDDEFKRTGIYEYTGAPETGPQALTGRIIGRSADLNNQNGSNARHWPRTEAGNWPAQVK